MDPLTAFTLAASIIQVIDFSSRAVERCRQIYETGTTAANQDTADIPVYLSRYELQLTSPYATDTWTVVFILIEMM